MEKNTWLNTILGLPDESETIYDGKLIFAKPVRDDLLVCFEADVKEGLVTMTQALFSNEQVFVKETRKIKDAKEIINWIKEKIDGEGNFRV